MGKTLSGKFVLRIPPRLHARLKHEADSRGISLNAHCRRVLAAAHSESERHRGLGEPETDLVKTILATFGDRVAGVILFGSAARGTSSASSDIDLLILIHGSIPITRALYAEWDQARPPGHYSPLFVHLPDAPADAGALWFEAALDGVVLYEHHLGISRLLGKIRRDIAEGNIALGHAHGHPYWIDRRTEEKRNEE